MWPELSSEQVVKSWQWIIACTLSVDRAEGCLFVHPVRSRILEAVSTVVDVHQLRIDEIHLGFALAVTDLHDSNIDKLSLMRICCKSQRPATVLSLKLSVSESTRAAFYAFTSYQCQKKIDDNRFSPI